MRFLVDAQLPPALCEWLQDRGHDARHVSQVDLASAADSVIASLAEQEGLTLISKDEDFVALRLPDRYVLLWLRCGNTTTAALSAWLAVRWQQVEALLASGERMIELR